MESDFKNQWILEMYRSVPIFIQQNTEIQTLEELFLNFNMASIQCGGIGFNSELTENSNWQFFAFEDCYWIAVNKQTLEIEYVDSYSLKSQYRLAPGLEIFLKILIDLAKYSLKGLRGIDYNQSDRSKILEMCLANLKEEKYHNYYLNSFQD